MRWPDRQRRCLGAALAALALFVSGCASVPGDTVAGHPATSEPGLGRSGPAQAPVVPSGPLSQIGTASMPGGPVASLAAPADLWERIRRGLALKPLDDDLVREEVLSDGELASDELDRAHADVLRSAGPWGQGFPEPVFDGVFDVLDWRVVGEKHLKFSLRAGGHAAPLNAIQFNGWHDVPPPTRIQAAYQLDTDDWRDRRGIQLLLRHWQAAD